MSPQGWQGIGSGQHRHGLGLPACAYISYVLTEVHSSAALRAQAALEGLMPPAGRCQNMSDDPHQIGSGGCLWVEIRSELYDTMLPYAERFGCG